jgi:hypothetical protein
MAKIKKVAAVIAAAGCFLQTDAFVSSSARLDAKTPVFRASSVVRPHRNSHFSLNMAVEDDCPSKWWQQRQMPDSGISAASREIIRGCTSDKLVEILPRNLQNFNELEPRRKLAIKLQMRMRRCAEDLPAPLVNPQLHPEAVESPASAPLRAAFSRTEAAEGHLADLQKKSDDLQEEPERATFDPTPEYVRAAVHRTSIAQVRFCNCLVKSMCLDVFLSRRTRTRGCIVVFCLRSATSLIFFSYFCMCVHSAVALWCLSVFNTRSIVLHIYIC